MLCILIIVFIRLNRSPLVRAVVYPVGSRTGLLIYSFDKLETLCFDFAYSSRSDYSRSALSKLLSIVFRVGYISVGSIDDAGCLCCLPCRSSVRRAKRQKNSTHSFIKTPNGVLNLFNISVVRFSRVRRSSFRLRLVLPLRSPPEALAALEGLRLGKVPERTGKETVHEPRKANSSDLS